jgi:arabinogalactan endo-1,4-beta-galactosidase
MKIFNRLPLVMVGLMAGCVSMQAKDFWLGADISGTTADEARHRTVYTTDGVPMETTKLMKEYGMNAVRLRVWVNPRGGFSSPEDVLKMALRAKENGMDIMIDFHYSDWWADPAKQNIPKQWENMNLEQMKQALADHTAYTLNLLKSNGVDVKWVQVGNETTNGFLWGMAKLPEDAANYAALTQVGYDAVKSVYPSAEVIVHLDNGFDQDLYDRVFDGLKANGAKWDIIGMSVYPFWAIDAGKEPDAESTLRDALANIRHLKAKYGTDVMVVETGVAAGEPEEGYLFIKDLINQTYSTTDDACLGVFYWAPECNAESPYKLGAFSNDRPTKIMDAFKEAATELLK